MPGSNPDDLLALLRGRRSLKPRLLVPPGPTREDIAAFAAVAFSAPDHGQLRPWRFVQIEKASHPKLAEAFAAAALELDPAASPSTLTAARSKAMDSPCVVALVAITAPDHPYIPLSEQLIAVGAALQSFLLAMHASGFGGMILSGRRVTTSALRRAFTLQPNEHLVGFIVAGTPAGEPKPKPPPSLVEHLSVWR